MPTPTMGKPLRSSIPSRQCQSQPTVHGDRYVARSNKGYNGLFLATLVARMAESTVCLGRRQGAVHKIDVARRWSARSALRGLFAVLLLWICRDWRDGHSGGDWRLCGWSKVVYQH